MRKWREECNERESKPDKAGNKKTLKTTKIG